MIENRIFSSSVQSFEIESYSLSDMVFVSNRTFSQKKDLMSNQ